MLHGLKKKKKRHIRDVESFGQTTIITDTGNYEHVG